MNLYCYNYNNYYNRIVKKSDNLSDYGTPVHTQLGVEGFQYADGIDTAQVLNYTAGAKNPDYLVVTDDDNNIDSRWFILDASYNRLGQYTVTLRRDVLADNLDRVLNSTCFVAKGYVDNGSPFIYNKESLGVNQIKKGEYELKSNNKFPWLVAYLARYHKDDEGEFAYNEFKGDLVDEVNTDPDYQLSSLSNYIYQKYTTYSGHTAAGYRVPRTITFDIPYRYTPTTQNTGTWSELVNGVASRALSDNYSYLVTNILLTKSGVPTKLIDLKGNISTCELNNTYNTTYWSIKYKVKSGVALGAPIQFLVGRNCIMYQWTKLSENSYSNSDGDGSPTSNDYPYWNKYAGNGNRPADNISAETASAWYNELYEVMQDGFEPEAGTGLDINAYTGSYNLGTRESMEVLMAENGKIIQVGTGSSAKYYRISVESSTTSALNAGSSRVVVGTALFNKMKEIMYSNFQEHFTDGATYTNFKVRWGVYNVDEIKLNITEIGAVVPKYDIKYDQGITRDAEFEIIAAPYTNESFQYKLGNTTYTVYQNKDLALKWFEDIASRYHEAGQLYDIQLLPYLPAEYDTHDFRNFPCFDLAYTSGADRFTYAFGVKIAKSSFSLNYSVNNLLPSGATSTDFADTLRTDFKKATNLDVYRFVSPNGVGEYEFSPSKNGSLTNFEIDCTLMPYNPYIKVNPLFGNLYGGDFNDYRGLICNGDFSLPILSDAWSTYQINNKYYQQIFDRNIATEEYNNSRQLWGDIAGAAGGVGAGAAAGAIAGSVAGPVGTVVGAIAGGVISAGAGVADIFINKDLREEEIQRKKDQFQFELGTIKARPQSLTRTTSININNKYFPYIEYYTCTPEEEAAFENKIQYSGMTVGVIGKLADYAGAPTDYVFLQGQVIDINLEDDAHFASVINDRLTGGVRL